MSFDAFQPEFDPHGELSPPSHGYNQQGDPVYFQTNGRGDVTISSFGHNQQGDLVFSLTNGSGELTYFELDDFLTYRNSAGQLCFDFNFYNRLPADLKKAYMDKRLAPLRLTQNLDGLTKDGESVSKRIADENPAFMAWIESGAPSMLPVNAQSKTDTQLEEPGIDAHDDSSTEDPTVSTTASEPSRHSPEIRIHSRDQSKFSAKLRTVRRFIRRELNLY